MMFALTQIFFAIVMLDAASMALSQTYWVFSLATEMVPQFTAVALFCIVLLVSQRRLLQGATLLVVVAFASWPIVALYLPRPTPAYSADTEQRSHLSVMSVNVNRRNVSYDLLRDRIESERPSLIALQEVTPAWVTALQERIGAEYPYMFSLPATDDYRGMALFSKIPMVTHEALYFASESAPVLRVTFSDPHLTLYNVHTLSPVTEQWAAERKGLLGWLAPQIYETPGTVVVAGDFNMSNTNPLFRDFLSKADVEDARAGFGWQPSWERGTLMSAAIDQILYRGLRSTRFRVLSDIGSDHRPILGTFTALLATNRNE